VTNLGTNRILKLRALICAIVAASLVAPRIAERIAADERYESVQVVGLASATPAIQLTGRGARFDHARQGPGADTAFTPVHLQNQRLNCVRIRQVVDGSGPHSLTAGKEHSGRSPPVAIS
jgi:hypothetical protein